jgi:hypothetical protein
VEITTFPQLRAISLAVCEPTSSRSSAADSDWDYVLANSSAKPSQCAGTHAPIGAFPPATFARV